LSARGKRGHAATAPIRNEKPDMRGPPFITDADLARAREDADFRQRLLTNSLELLLAELNKLQRATNTNALSDQMREGAELAVKLADLLRKIASRTPQAA
jgi:hypothetical protein